MTDQSEHEHDIGAILLELAEAWPTDGETGECAFCGEGFAKFVGLDYVERPEHRDSDCAFARLRRWMGRT